jgi:hypothetical protein
MADVRRAGLACLIGLLATIAWADAPPELRLAPDAPRVNLTLHMAAQQLPADSAITPLDPDQAWEGDADETAPGA